MTIRLMLLSTIIPLLFTTATFASSNNADKVAKVIIVRGQVTATESNGESYLISKGLWLKQGTSLESKSRSFAKLLFIDKSQMNLGPESKLVITAFPKNKAGILTLLKGQLRSKVTKDYMGIQNKNKSKLFIKTTTAAMGVRGTHFQVNFNPVNQVTSLVTFEGAVAMVQLNDLINKIKSNQKALENIVSSDQAVMVKRGQYSGANPKQLRVTNPVKINPAQLKVLEKNEGEKIKTPDQVQRKVKIKSKTSFRSIVPPGVNPEDFANDTKALDKSMESTVGTKVAQKVFNQVKRIKRDTKAVASSTGNINYITGEVTPPAGGYVDTRTGLYISPPKGSAYDNQTQTFIPPPHYGGFDPDTGDYVNNDFTLTTEGTFVKIPEKDTRRGPASTNNGPVSGSAAAPEMAPPPFAACLTNECQLAPPPTNVTGPAPGPPPPPPTQNTNCQVNGTCPPPPPPTLRNVKFIFN
jgi:hypothetical protein